MSRMNDRIKDLEDKQAAANLLVSCMADLRDFVDETYDAETDTYRAVDTDRIVRDFAGTVARVVAAIESLAALSGWPTKV